MQSIHDYVLTELEARKGHWPDVARASGVPYSTLKKIAQGGTKSPRIGSLEKLAAYLRCDGRERHRGGAAVHALTRNE